MRKTTKPHSNLAEDPSYDLVFKTGPLTVIKRIYLINYLKETIDFIEIDKKAMKIGSFTKKLLWHKSDSW